LFSFFNLNNIDKNNQIKKLLLEFILKIKKLKESQQWLTISFKISSISLSIWFNYYLSHSFCKNDKSSFVSHRFTNHCCLVKISFWAIDFKAWICAALKTIYPRSKWLINLNLSIFFCLLQLDYRLPSFLLNMIFLIQEVYIFISSNQQQADIWNNQFSWVSIYIYYP